MMVTGRFSGFWVSHSGIASLVAVLGFMAVMLAGAPPAVADDTPPQEVAAQIKAEFHERFRQRFPVPADPRRKFLMEEFIETVEELVDIYEGLYSVPLYRERMRRDLLALVARVDENYFERPNRHQAIVEVARRAKDFVETIDDFEAREAELTKYMESISERVRSHIESELAQTTDVDLNPSALTEEIRDLRTYITRLAISPELERQLLDAALDIHFRALLETDQNENLKRLRDEYLFFPVAGYFMQSYAGGRPSAEDFDARMRGFLASEIRNIPGSPRGAMTSRVYTALMQYALGLENVGWGLPEMPPTLDLDKIVWHRPLRTVQPAP